MVFWMAKLPCWGKDENILDRTLHELYFYISVLSLISSLFVIVAYLSRRKKKQHPAVVQFWRSVTDAFFAAGIIILTLMCDDWIDPELTKQLCGWMGAIFQFTLFASQNWFFMLSIDLMYSLFNPFSELGNNVKYYHMFSWGVAALSVVAMTLTPGEFGWRNNFQICWITSVSTSEQNIYAWTLFFTPTIIYYVFGIFVTIVAHKRIRKGIRETLALRSEILHNTVIINFAFVMYWTVAGVLYYILSSEIEDNDNPTLFKSFAVVIGGLGVVDATAWILTQYEPCRRFRGLKAEDMKPVNYALRREIIFFTAKGICDSLDLGKDDYPAEDLPPIGSVAYPKKLHPKGTTRGSELLELTDDYSDTSAPFIDYAPSVFRYIRKLLGISEEGYREIFGKTLSGSRDKMKERFTEGKSGSFFYFTPDMKYIVKTMYKDEVTFFLKILPHYAEHIANYENTLLCKFVGFHSVRLYDTNVYFVVMESVFLTDLPIHERYDIKGSTVNRYSKGKLPRKDGYISGVMKDGDVHKLFLITSDRKNALEIQCEIDAAFCERMSIMDYSMLVGVRYVQLGHPERDNEAKTSFMVVEEKVPGDSREIGEYGSLLTASISDDAFEEMRHRRSTVPQVRTNYYFHAHEGGVRAEVVEGPGVYYFGIIDILQEYNYRKWFENFFKTWILCGEKNGISCVPPGRYATRFVNKVKEITKSKVQPPKFNIKNENGHEENAEVVAGQGLPLQVKDAVPKRKKMDIEL